MGSIEIEPKERVFGRHIVIVYGDDCIPKSPVFDTNPAPGTREFVVDIRIERPIGQMRKGVQRVAAVSFKVLRLRR